MKKKLSTLLLVASYATGVISAPAAGFEKGEHGVVLERNGMTLNIEVVDESIIHVKKTNPKVKENILPDYVTILDPQKVAWEAKSRGKDVVVTTDKMVVTIDSKGVVSYRDKAGKILTAETTDATWIDAAANPDFPVSQSFVAGDEAIYGLGQYQNGIINLRGVSVRMAQHNQEIVVPFIISTNGYGIYWHNYSNTDFNHPADALTFDNEVVDGKVVKSVDDELQGIDKEDVAEAPKDKYAVIKRMQQGTFTPTQTGRYTFFIESDVSARKKCDVKLIIDGDTIVNYVTMWAPQCYSGIKTLKAGHKYNVTLQNDGATTTGVVLYNKPDFNRTSFTSTAGTTIDYYLIAGASPVETMENYQKLTGKAPMFARKSYGFWHCRERFRDQQELLENAREYRARKIPVDNIVQDWYYWPRNAKGPEWDRKKYPDPKAMTKELRELNLNLMVSVWPEVQNTPVLEKYGIEKLKLGGRDYLDFYDEKVQRGFYKALRDSMFRVGVNSIWLDGSEADCVSLTSKCSVGEFKNVSNSYSLLVSKSVYEGLREEFPEKRVFNLTRSAFAGQQRYGVASWSGDVAATWGQYLEQITAGLNFSMAGVPYWTHDIGGFFRDSLSLNPTFDNQYKNKEYIELLSRWFQFGALSPIFRLHGYKSKTEVWNYGAEFEALARKYIDLRYELMPYIYSEAWRVTTDSRVLMSPLAYYFPEDKKAWDIKDQYLFGESIMVCPVVKYLARTREVYLPKGEWYNFWSGEKTTGGKSIESPAALDELPLYVKAGSIIPLGAKVQYATEPNDEPLRIRVYGGADGSFVLHLDDNESYEYEKGAYSQVEFTYSEAKKELTIKSIVDKYRGFARNPLKLVVESVGSGESSEVTFAGKRINIAIK